MAFKTAVVQQPQRTTTGDQDFADPIFSGDCKAAIFVTSRVGKDGNTTGFRSGIGFAAAISPSQCASCWTFSGSTGTTDATSSSLSTAACIRTRSGDVTAVVKDFGVTNSQGMTVTYTAVQTGGNVYALLLGGDIEASVVSANWTSETGTKTVTHNLSGAPEIILALGSVATGVDGEIGFWSSGSYATSGMYCANAVTTTVTNQETVNDKILSLPNSSVSFTLANVGATTFDAVASGTVSRVIAFLCLRGTVNPIVASTGTFDAPTGTGTSSVVSGMSVDPTVLLTVPSKRTTLGAGATDGAFGLGMTVNNGGTTQYGCITFHAPNGETPVDANSAYLTDDSDRALVVLANDDTKTLQATTQWDVGGVSLVYSASSTAYKIPYLAFGMTSTPPPTPTPSMGRCTYILP